MKTPKYKIGDKILVRGETNTIEAVDIRIRKFNTSIYYFYYVDTDPVHRWDCAIHEDAIVLAPRYAVGDKVWCMLNNSIYQCRVAGAFRTGRYHVVSQKINTHLNEFDLHLTKESLLESIPCHDHQI